MKVMHVASGDLWAGAEVQLYHLARELATNQAIDLLIVLMNDGQLAQVLRASGVRVVVIDETKLSGLRILARLMRLVQEFRPALIHTHRNKENVIGGLVAILTGCPSVRTVHGASEFAESAFSLKRMVFGFLDRIVGKLIQKKVIAVSEELALKLLRYFPERKLTVIHNGINVKEVCDKANLTIDFTCTPETFNVAFVGRFVPVKRTDLFLDIAENVITKPSNTNIHFHMFGDGPLRDDVIRRVCERDNQNRIHAHGFVSDVAPYLKQMDLLLFTSDHEGLPMTLLEAMALQIAVMSRDLPTIRQVLCDGKCGYILKNDSISEFSSAIERLYEDRASCDAMTVKALANLDTQYNITRIAHNYVALYRDVIQPKTENI